MGQVFITRNRKPEYEEIDGQEPYADFQFTGTYFFLYPDILRLFEQTGELIDPQKDAFFCGPGIELFGHFLVTARERVVAQPEYWEQHVAKSYPSGEPVFRLTSKAEVLEFLDRLAGAVTKAREKGMGVFFLGE